MSTVKNATKPSLEELQLGWESHMAFRVMVRSCLSGFNQRLSFKV